MKTASVIAANRFGLGARPGDLPGIDRDPEAWLVNQLQGPSRTPTDLRRLPTTASVLKEVQELRRMQREQKRGDDNAATADPVKNFGSAVRRHFVEQTEARYRLAAATDFPFFERLVHFWSNHFAVSADKPPLPAIAGLFENEAIRPNVTGTMTDLLIAAERHPAMILYLDNQRSIGPGSTLGQRARRRGGSREFGINENLAREILELHTLGVDGGYTQEDVTTFAKVITGWSIGGVNERGRFAEGTPGEFEFREAIHEPGPQRILGRTYKDDGVRQGEAVLRDLATHPSTAEFLAKKLARHFVSDHPPDALVDKLTAVYLDSGGDLTRVYAALVSDDAGWQTPFAKYKTPHDFVISTFRAFRYRPDGGRFVARALDLMGQAPFRPGSPAGWPDTAEQWGGADGLMKRIEWSNTVARIVGSSSNPVELGEAILGPVFTGATRKAISRAESVTQGMTLLLASPDFQRR